MLINTLYFGEVEIDEKNILRFEEGLPGFDEIKDYAILTDEDQDTPFRWLQAVGELHPAFAVISPFEVIPDYEIDIDKATEEFLEIKNPSDVAVYSIVVIPEDLVEMTANLKAPLIINVTNNKGRQMILDNSKYQIKHYILEEILKAKVKEEKALQDKEGK